MEDPCIHVMIHIPSDFATMIIWGCGAGRALSADRLGLPIERLLRDAPVKLGKDDSLEL